MRLFLLISFFSILSVLDAATTIHLNENFPEGRELNPYVYPGSWTGLLLAPVKFPIYAGFLICVLFAEKKAKAISAEGGLLSDAALVAYFALFLMFTKLLAIINNLMPMLGISTPISYALAAMEYLPGDEMLHYTMFWSLMFLLMAPVGLMVIRTIYSSEQPK